MPASLFIDLDRRFVPLRDREWSDMDVEALAWGGDLGWPEILKLPRVVVLAEAGGGKTTEMKEFARRQARGGRFAFYATVQDIGRDGLESALGRSQRTSFVAWRASDKPAWFFIDSVDEAKWDSIRLSSALEKLADALADDDRRAHVILSGRYSDWDFRTDLATYGEVLPVPGVEPQPPPPTSDELFLRAVRNERPRERTEPSPPQMFVMAALDEPRVRAYAAAKGVPNLDALIDAIEVANLWRFARRPLDLGWMVDFWRANQRLGTLAEMLEVSLSERLKETNSAHGLRDTLDEERCWQAIERVGAAMVFCRADTIALPSDEVEIESARSALDLAKILPDWSREERGRLLGRAVFDPATLGRVRFHNDNQGVVRGYLAARWIQRLRANNCPASVVSDLLFADVYGLEVIKPSARETVAWLSLGDEGVAREALARDPFVLIDSGDPGSLKASPRARVLQEMVRRLASSAGQMPMLDHDNLRRFVTSELAEPIRDLWRSHSDNAEIRKLLMLMISLGQLSACVDLAIEVVFGPGTGGLDRVLAGRALLAMADEATKVRFADLLRTRAASLPTAEVWDAVDGLFPDYLSIDELMQLYDSVPDNSALDLRLRGSKLAARLERVEDLERFLTALLSRYGTDPTGDDAENKEDLAPSLTTASLRLLRRSREDNAPQVAIDAALSLVGPARARRGRGREEQDLLVELRRTAARRRALFWRASERHGGNKLLNGQPINLWQMEYLGWPKGLELADLDWVLTDCLQREAEDDRRLALTAAIQIWRENGSEGAVRNRIESAVRADAQIANAFAALTTPRPESEEMQATLRQMEEMRAQHDEADAAVAASWADFVGEMQADPEQIRRIVPPTGNSGDRRLFSLWSLAARACGRDNRFAISDLSAIEPAFGSALTGALRDALIAFWRPWKPRLKSSRAPSERNLIYDLDSMAIAGVSLDAARTPDWASSLTDEDAANATRLATLELNGFPDWLTAVVVARPDAVREALMAEISSELDDPDSERRPDVLQDVARADPVIAKVVTPRLFAELEAGRAMSARALELILDIIVRGGADFVEELRPLLFARFGDEPDPALAALYIVAAFAVDPAAAVDVLIARLNTLPPAKQTDMAQRILPGLFGDTFYRSAHPAVVLPFSALVRLVELAYRTIRPEDDKERRSGVVYSFDERDHAESARSGAFNQLFGTPGFATYVALLRFAETPDFPVPSRRLRELAVERAVQDADGNPWAPEDARAFEYEHEHAPRTTAELQLVATRRLEGIQADLLHSDFAQGATLKMLGDEKAVQNYVAHELRRLERRAYSVERESHVVQEKEPDIRLRAKASTASLPVEIKVAENWSLPQLEAALAEQLCGQYLRAADAQDGILLLVHQTARSSGWKQPDTGAMLTFDEVVLRLQGLASAIAKRGPDSPRAVIAVLDVSSCN